MEKLRVFADPLKPDQRVYQLSEDVAGEAFLDMLDSFRQGAFMADMGAKIGPNPVHDIQSRLQAIEGVGTLAMSSPNYFIFKNDEASWDDLHEQIIEVFRFAFGKIETVELVDGPLA